MVRSWRPSLWFQLSLPNLRDLSLADQVPNFPRNLNRDRQVVLLCERRRNRFRSGVEDVCVLHGSSMLRLKDTSSSTIDIRFDEDR